MSPAMIELAARKHPGLDFRVHDLMRGPLDERFDYVVAADVAEHVPDLDKMMSSLAGMLTANGVAVVVTANPLWALILHIAERLRLKMPEGDHEWRSRENLVGGGRACRVARALVRSVAGDAEGGSRIPSPRLGTVGGEAPAARRAHPARGLRACRRPLDRRSTGSAEREAGELVGVPEPVRDDETHRLDRAEQGILRNRFGAHHEHHPAAAANSLSALG